MHIAQQMPLPLTISCSSKSRLVLTFLVLPFWYLLTRVVPDKFQKSRKTVVCLLQFILLLIHLMAIFSRDPGSANSPFPGSPPTVLEQKKKIYWLNTKSMQWQVSRQVLLPYCWPPLPNNALLTKILAKMNMIESLEISRMGFLQATYQKTDVNTKQQLYPVN